MAEGATLSGGQRREARRGPEGILGSLGPWGVGLHKLLPDSACGMGSLGSSSGKQGLGCRPWASRASLADGRQGLGQSSTFAWVVHCLTPGVTPHTDFDVMMTPFSFPHAHSCMCIYTYTHTRTHHSHGTWKVTSHQCPYVHTFLLPRLKMAAAK